MSHIIKKHAIFSTFILYILYFDFTSLGFLDGLLVAKEYYPVDSFIELFFYIPQSEETAALNMENLLGHAFSFSMEASTLIHLSLGLVLQFVCFPFLSSHQQDFLSTSILPKFSANIIMFLTGRFGSLALILQFGLSFFGLSSLPSYIAYFAPEIYLTLFVHIILKNVLVLFVLSFPFVVYSVCKNLAEYLTTFAEIQPEYYTRPAKGGLFLVAQVRGGYLINPPPKNKNPLRVFFVQYVGLLPIMLFAVYINYWGLLIDEVYQPVHVNVRMQADFCAGYMMIFLLMQHLPVPNSAAFNLLSCFFPSLVTLYEKLFPTRNQHGEICSTTPTFIAYYVFCASVAFSPISYMMINFNYYASYNMMYEDMSLFIFLETFYAGLYVTVSEGGWSALLNLV